MRELTYAQAVKEAMTLEMRRDETVFFMGEDIGIYGGAFGVTKGMFEEFGPERVRDTPISESAITGAAAGAAMMGMRPIVEMIFSDFCTIAMDQLVNQAAKMRYMHGGDIQVPMVVRMPAGSGTGAAAQHSQSLEAWFCHIPGLKVVAASTPADAKGLLTASIRDNNPVVFFEQKLLYKTKGEVPEGEYVLPLGKSHVVREGCDVTVVTYGRMLQVCLDAAQEAEKQGVSVEVIDPRTLYPMDRETIIRSVVKTGRLVVVHEACKTGGVGAEIAAAVAESEAFHKLKAPIQRVCGLDVPIPFSKELEASVAPNAVRVREAICSMM